MKLVLYTIASCKGCKWREGMLVLSKCRQEGKSIPNISTFPDWCPLEDYKEGKMNTIFKVKYDFYTSQPGGQERTPFNTGKIAYIQVESKDIKEALLIAEEEISRKCGALSTEGLMVRIRNISEIGELLN